MKKARVWRNAKPGQSLFSKLACQVLNGRQLINIVSLITHHPECAVQDHWPEQLCPWEQTNGQC